MGGDAKKRGGERNSLAGKNPAREGTATYFAAGAAASGAAGAAASGAAASGAATGAAGSAMGAVCSTGGVTTSSLFLQAIMPVARSSIRAKATVVLTDFMVLFLCVF
ncbi:MAG TPA: hypothetical protein DEQ20_02960 [Desulfobulbaceae bacterium]|nr:hypothetical protein [Desulfobulbaceae bacterium]